MVDLGGFYSVRVRVLHNSDTENVRDLSTSISRADGSGGTAYRNPHLNPNPTLTLEPSIPIHITSTLPGHNLTLLGYLLFGLSSASSFMASSAVPPMPRRSPEPLLR